MNKVERWIIFSIMGITSIVMLIFSLQGNPIALALIMMMGFIALYILIRTEMEDRKKGRKSIRWYLRHKKCPDCKGSLIHKDDLWINDEEWGVPENYMCTKCGKGVDLPSVA